MVGRSISEHRDRELIRTLLIRVRACGPIEQILLLTDGLASYASQALHVFREPLRTGKVGRPRLVLAAAVMIARVKKRYQRRRVVEVIRRVVVGCEAEVISRVIGTQRSIQGVDQYRLHRASKRHLPGRLAPLVRRTRAGAHKQCTLEAGDVAGGQLLQLRVGASHSRGGAHPGDGGGAYGSSLVDGGVVDVSSAARRVTQVARAQAAVAVGGRVCSLTTVQCGATRPLVAGIFSVLSGSVLLLLLPYCCQT